MKRLNQLSHNIIFPIEIKNREKTRAMKYIPLLDDEEEEGDLLNGIFLIFGVEASFSCYFRIENNQMENR